MLNFPWKTVLKQECAEICSTSRKLAVCFGCVPLLHLYCQIIAKHFHRLGQITQVADLTPQNLKSKPIASTLYITNTWFLRSVIYSFHKL